VEWLHEVSLQQWKIQDDLNFIHIGVIHIESSPAPNRHLEKVLGCPHILICVVEKHDLRFGYTFFSF
jgi:hypothetical protein